MESPLLALLSDQGRLERARRGGAVLWPEAHPAVAFVKAVFALAGWPAPAAATVPELVAALCAWRFQAIPSGLQAPQAGDLWVATDGPRLPFAIGFVQKVSTAGDWFYEVSGTAGTRIRMERATVDFILRPPAS